MSNYAKAAYGLISADIPGGSTDVIKALLKSYALNTRDYNLMCSGGLYKEASQAMCLLVGDSFKDFLIANYDQGKGQRASTIRVITQYLCGEIGHRPLTQRIKGDFLRTRGFMTAAKPQYNTTVNDVKECPATARNLTVITDDDYYTLLACIGGPLMARWLLTFLGVADE